MIFFFFSLHPVFKLIRRDAWFTAFVENVTRGTQIAGEAVVIRTFWEKILTDVENLLSANFLSFSFSLIATVGLVENVFNKQYTFRCPVRHKPHSLYLLLDTHQFKF